MKTFKQFLLEMSVDDALRVFGLQGKSYTGETIKQTYKSLAMQHHPDRGGSLEMMKQVNAAYDLLKGTAQQIKYNDDFRQRYEKEKELSKEKATAIINKLSKKFESWEFPKYFEDIFGEPFHVEISTTDPNKQYGYVYSVYLSAEFYNVDRSIVFYFSLSTSTTTSGGLGSTDQELPLYIWTEILYKRKKIKLSQQNYDMSTSYSILSDPEKLFPRKKIEAQIGKPAKPMKKADILLTFKRELQADIDGQFVYVPLFDDYKLCLYRSVIMRSGSWGINGLYKKFKRVHMGAYNSFYERDDIIHWLIDELKKMQQLKSEAEIINQLNGFRAEYERKFK